MPRATNAPASRERRKRVLKSAKGYRGRRSKLFRYAKDATMKGKYWAYRDRKTRKRNFRISGSSGSTPPCAPRASPTVVSPKA